MTFDAITSQREEMLEALAYCLGTITGVRKVCRQAITEEMLSDAELPGIIIDEAGTTYEWEERHLGRHSRYVSTVVLDLQARCQRTSGARFGNVSTIRELFVWAVINHIANNPRLLCQLTGEDESMAHCEDAGLTFGVEYAETDFPYVRAMLAITVTGYDQFDDRAANTWVQAILTMAPEATEDFDESDSAVEVTIDVDGEITTIADSEGD